MPSLYPYPPQENPDHRPSAGARAPAEPSVLLELTTQELKRLEFFRQQVRPDAARRRPRKTLSRQWLDRLLPPPRENIAEPTAAARTDQPAQGGATGSSETGQAPPPQSYPCSRCGAFSPPVGGYFPFWFCRECRRNHWRDKAWV